MNPKRIWLMIVMMMLAFNFSITIANEIFIKSWGQGSSPMADPVIKFADVSTSGLTYEAIPLVGFILRGMGMIADFFKSVWNFVRVGSQIKQIFAATFGASIVFPESIKLMLDGISLFMYSFTLIMIILGQRFD